MVWRVREVVLVHRLFFEWGSNNHCPPANATRVNNLVNNSSFIIIIPQ